MCGHYQALKEREQYARISALNRRCTPARWMSGRVITAPSSGATRIARVNGEPLGIAGLWSKWKSSQGELLFSYTLLTINADAPGLNSRRKERYD